MLSNLANPLPHPQHHALGTLCRVYELPESACCVGPMHRTKVMTLVPRLWEWSLLVTGLQSSPVST